MGGLAVATSTLLISVYGAGGVKRAPDRTKRCAEPFVEVRQDGRMGTFLRMHQYLPPRSFTTRLITAFWAAPLRGGES
jgi:hypothetical protein